MKPEPHKLTSVELTMHRQLHLDTVFDNPGSRARNVAFYPHMFDFPL